VPDPDDEPDPVLEPVEREPELEPVDAPEVAAVDVPELEDGLDVAPEAELDPRVELDAPLLLVVEEEELPGPAGDPPLESCTWLGPQAATSADTTAAAATKDGFISAP
jgi:hypothetical protein